MEESWTIPRYRAMQEYWSCNGPPVYMSVAGYLGLIKTKKRSKPETGDLEELARMFAATGGQIA